MKRIQISLAVVLTGLIVGALAMVVKQIRTPEQASKIELVRADRDLLQKLATDACACELESDGRSCREAYDKAAAPFRSEPSGTAASACTPISTEWDMLRDANGEFSVVLGYTVVETLPKGMNPRLCQRTDAKAVEAAFNKAVGPAPDLNKPVDERARRAAYEAANRAIVETITAIRSGERIEPVEHSNGCA